MIEAMRLELSPYNVRATFIEAGTFRSSIIPKSTYTFGIPLISASTQQKSPGGAVVLAEYKLSHSTLKETNNKR